MKMFMAFVHKEFLHILRDKRTMIILLLMPILLILLFGFAISTEIKNARFAVADFENTIESKLLIKKIDANVYFDLYQVVSSVEDLDMMLRQGNVKVGVVIKPNVGSQHSQEIEILSNASDPNEATVLTFYMRQLLNDSFASDDSSAFLKGIQSTVHLLYNPLMKSSYNFVPGVMGLILILICTMMTCICVVREKEQGSMEVLLVSPLRPLYILLAKVVPYILISCANIISILLLARYLLGVPLLGSLWLLSFVTFIYILVALFLGILISTIAETQQTAMLISSVAMMLPVVLLSGMIFPVANMPIFLQILSPLVPARWYIEAVRSIMIKGLGWEAVLHDILILLAMALVVGVISLKRFKVRL